MMAWSNVSMDGIFVLVIEEEYWICEGKGDGGEEEREERESIGHVGDIT